MKRILVLVLVMAASCAYAQPTASSTVYGLDGAGNPVPLSVEADGRLKVNRMPVFSDGSSEASAHLQPDNSVSVTIVRDSSTSATKTTSNLIASATPQQISMIPNVRQMIIFVTEPGSTAWIKVGGIDAGLNSGIPVSDMVSLDGMLQTDVVSYYASPSCRIAVIQK